jgi:hypothetical protein
MCICSNTFFITIRAKLNCNKNSNNFYINKNYPLLYRFVLFLIRLYFFLPPLPPPLVVRVELVELLATRRREKQLKYFFHHGKEDDDVVEGNEEHTDPGVKLFNNICALSILSVPMVRKFFGITTVYNILILFLLFYDFITICSKLNCNKN